MNQLGAVAMNHLGAASMNQLVAYSNCAANAAQCLRTYLTKIHDEELGSLSHAMSILHTQHSNAIAQ